MADTCYVTDTGLGLVVDALESADSYKYVAWGTGTTPAAATDTALETIAAPTATTAATGTISQVTTSSTGDTYQVVATITAGSSLAITEVGILNQATVSGASVFLRGTFDAINVSADDSIEFTIKAQFNQA